MELEEINSPQAKNMLSYSTGRQVFMYAISAILPLFGLGWAFKYLKSGSLAGKKIGIAIILITLISLVINIILFVPLLKTIYELNNSNLQMYKDLGY